jgi:hypothetical protein
MKTNVCDVCYWSSGLLVKASHRTTIKEGSGFGRIVYDVCPDHRNFTKGLSFKDAQDKVNGLFSGSQRREG